MNIEPAHSSAINFRAGINAALSVLLLNTKQALNWSSASVNFI